MAAIPTVAVPDGKGGEIIVNAAEADQYKPAPKAKAKPKAKPK